MKNAQTEHLVARWLEELLKYAIDPLRHYQGRKAEIQMFIFGFVRYPISDFLFRFLSPDNTGMSGEHGRKASAGKRKPGASPARPLRLDPHVLTTLSKGRDGRAQSVRSPLLCGVHHYYWSFMFSLLTMGRHCSWIVSL